MKELKKEIRLLIAEWLLGLAFKIAPNDSQGERIKLMIARLFCGIKIK